ncbi:MAG: glycosyltransferase [Anaerolineae bacterium]|nr:glycosyltransferase [Anaerolineae bacterium]
MVPDDDTATIAQDYADKGVVTLFSPERRGKSAALNRGVKLASGDILIFSDANAYYYEDAIQKVVRNFTDPTVGGVSGKKTVRASEGSATETEGMYWKYESFIKKSESKSGSTAGVVGEMNAICKELYDDIPEDIINDDFYLALVVMGKGYRVLYEPEAVSWELPSLSVQDDNKRRRRMTAGRYQQMFMFSLWRSIGLANIFRVVSHKFFRLLLPFFMLGALVFNILVVAFPPRPMSLIVTLVLQLVAYDIALLGYFLERSGRKMKIPAAAYYVVNSNIASIRGLMRYLRDEQGVLWEKAQRVAQKN